MQYVFISCDIISHSAEPLFQKQLDNVAAINHIVGEELKRASNEGIIWASGGDGGHVAYPITCDLSYIFPLIIALRNWSIKSSVNLRITCNSGEAEAILGADNRMQLVGSGINLAGRLSPYGEQTRVIVTEDFIHHTHAFLSSDFEIHNKRTIQPTDFPELNVYLLSCKGMFTSTWQTRVAQTDRDILQHSLASKDTFEILYRAKRLLDINTQEKIAIDAFHTLVGKRFNKKNESSFIFDLLFDESFGLDFVRASKLVERRHGETLCEINDQGGTMFLIVRGQLGGILPKAISSVKGLSPPPDFIMNPGELAGELAFALNRPRTATLIALEDCALLAFEMAEIKDKIQSNRNGQDFLKTLDRKLLARIIENIWNTANYFRGDKTLPPIDTHGSPWLILLKHTQLESVPLGIKRLNPADFSGQFDGLCLLVSGKLHTKDRTRILDGVHYPILSATFPSEDFSFHEQDTLLQSDVKILKIAKEGFLELGQDVFLKLIEQISSQCAGNQILAKKVFDVFLSHNSKDKEGARSLGQALKNRNISVWFDEWELPPGSQWPNLIGEHIVNCKAALILIGGNGLGPWEELELNTFLSEFVQRKLPIIPVLLPDAHKNPQVPAFLKQFTWLDLKNGYSEEAISKLVWGITGERPE